MPTTINDLVSIYIDDKPAFYARIEEISPDVKQGWWQVRLLVLTHPLQFFTWILEESQINGTPFTMGGTPIRMEKLPPFSENMSDSNSPEVHEKGEGHARKESAKVVSLQDRKKDK